MQVVLERYSPTDCQRSTILPSADAVEATLLRIAEDWSSTLYIESDDGDVELMITASRGVSAALLRVGESFYDLVGDPGERGTSEFVHGGQPAPHPRRHLVGGGLAMKAARCFADDPNAVLKAAGFAWEEQGEKEGVGAAMPAKH